MEPDAKILLFCNHLNIQTIDSRYMQIAEVYVFGSRENHELCCYCIKYQIKISKKILQCMDGELQFLDGLNMIGH